MNNVWQDLKHGFRVLRKNPGFAVGAVVVLALGIGANTRSENLCRLVRELPRLAAAEQRL